MPFTAWARQIVFLILFVSLLESLLPAGELRRYVKALMGLVVLVALIHPLLQLARDGSWIDSLLIPETASLSFEATPVVAGMELKQAAVADMVHSVQSATEQEIAAQLLNIDGVQAADVRLVGDQPQITLVTRPGSDRVVKEWSGETATPNRITTEDALVQNQARRLVARALRVDVTDVHVVMQTGSDMNGGR